MAKELAALVATVAALHGRMTEAISRAQQDVRLLGDLHQELSASLNRLWRVCEEPAPPSPRPDAPRMLRIDEVSERIGLCRSSVWRMVKEGRFPSPQRLSRRAVGWLDVQIDDWLSGREPAGQLYVGEKASLSDRALDRRRRAE